MRVNIEPLKESHFYELNIQNSQELEFETFKSYITLSAITGNTFSYDGRIIACAGILPVWEGRGIVWMLRDENVPEECGVKFVRLARRWLDAAHDQMDLHRIETNCGVNNYRDYKWLRLIGFEVEGLMKKYSIEGSDHYMMARVR